HRRRHHRCFHKRLRQLLHLCRKHPRQHRQHCHRVRRQHHRKPRRQHCRHCRAEAILAMCCLLQSEEPEASALCAKAARAHRTATLPDLSPRRQSRQEMSRLEPSPVPISATPLQTCLLSVTRSLAANLTLKRTMTMTG
ncbi:hypothetical protein LPJ75_003206, partial [Coemansia sp. RSA 2598]